MTGTFKIDVPPEFRGKWVAVQGTKCLACGDTINEALRNANDCVPGSIRHCFVSFMRDESEEVTFNFLDDELVPNLGRSVSV